MSETLEERIRRHAVESRDELVGFYATDIVELLDNRDVDYARLVQLAREAVTELETQAKRAEIFHQRQEDAFDKWLSRRKGTKPVPALGLPIMASTMYRVASTLAAALPERTEDQPLANS